MLQAVDQRRHDASTRHAERMTERDRATVHVQLVHRDAEVLRRRNHLRRERFVDLDEIDVVNRHLCALQCLTNRLDRTQAHDLGIQTGHARRNDARERGDAQLLRLRVTHHHHGSCAVVQRTGVPRSDLAIGAESRLQVGEALDGRSVAGTIVLRHHGAVGKRDRCDFTFEETVVLVRDGELLRARAELVHLAARDTLDLAHVLGRLAHRDVDVGQTLRRRPRGLATFGTLLRALARVGEHRVRRRVTGAGTVATDALDTRGDEAVPLTRTNGVCRHADGLQARRAVTIHRHSRHVVETGKNGDDSGDVETLLAGRLAAAHHQVFDVVGLHLRNLGHQGFHHLGGQIIGSHVDERPLECAADRAAGGCDDDGFSHGSPCRGLRRQNPSHPKGSRRAEVQFLHDSAPRSLL